MISLQAMVISKIWSSMLSLCKVGMFFYIYSDTIFSHTCNPGADVCCMKFAEDHIGGVILCL